MSLITNDRHHRDDHSTLKMTFVNKTNDKHHFYIDIFSS